MTDVKQDTNFLDANLTERERQLIEQERILNAELDSRIQANHDKFPKAIYFILPNEFCERFCYYGIKSLLNQYMKGAFGLEEYIAKSQTHLFNALVYFFPLVGAAMSDSFLGKYHTIVYFSISYLIGNALLSIFSINNLLAPYGSYPFWSYIVPALLIAIGAGGIKPCVSAHGGDQFLPSQTSLMDKFFALFYVSINCGSLIAQYLTPYVKSYVECFGSQCYFVALIIPTGFFAIALGVFIFGHRYYRIVPPQGEFLPWKATKVAISAKVKYNKASPAEREAKGHWLKFAEEEYGAEFVEETRLFGKIVVMFVPIIFMWMLYDQNGSEWQNQYEKMEHTFLGFIPMPTEASSNINSILIIILVPILSYWIYPLLEKRGIRMPLLTRMIWGYGFVVLAFIIAVILEYSVNNNIDTLVLKEKVQESCVACINGTAQLPQWFFLSLGEAMISPTGVQFAYTQVGRQMKASSTSIWLLTSALGNTIVLILEQPLHLIESSANRQWIYIAIGIAGMIWFTLLAKFWYVSKEDEDATRGINEDISLAIKE